MRRTFHFVFLIIIFVPVAGFSSNLYSIASGNWSSTSVWSYTVDGPSCGCSPIASDNVTISDTIYMDKHLTNVGSTLNGITGVLTIDLGAALLGGGTWNIDIRSTGTLNLCGILTAKDVVFSNGSIVNVCVSGALTVNGDFFNKNNSNTVIIDGAMTVNGDYVNGNGGIISGIGTIAITSGSVTNTGSTYGCEGYDPCFGAYPCTVTSPCVSPLPVAFLSVNADWLEQGVEVKWTTASEVNNDHFDVLRSADAVDYTHAGSVPGSGTTSQLHRYAFLDAGLPANAHTLYYRIRQVDYDGRSGLSGVVVVRKKTSSSLVAVFPNPVSREKTAGLTVTLQNVSEAHISMTDARGRKVYEQQQKNLLPAAEVALPVSRLSPGVYFLKFQTDRDLFTCKVIVCN